MYIGDVIDKIKNPVIKIRMEQCIDILHNYKQMLGKPIPWMKRGKTAHDIDEVVETILFILNDWADYQLFTPEETEKILRED